MLVIKSIFVLFYIGIIIITIPSVSASSYLDMVQSNYDKLDDKWSLGNGIAEGDYYEYKICNDDIMYQIIYPYHCYTISLEFVTILTSWNSDVWVVQGNLTIGDTTPEISQPMIFLIDIDTFKVNTDILHKDVGASLENTIFSLSQYGEKSLSIGEQWDEIDSYYTNKIPLEIKNKQSIQILNGTLETSVLSYDIIIPSNVYLHKDFPFPLKAKLYSPNIIYPEPQELYYFELLEFGNFLKNSTILEDYLTEK